VTVPEGQEPVIAILRVLAAREGGIARHEIVEVVLTDAGSGPDDTPTVDLRRTAFRRVRRMLRRLEQEGAVRRIERGIHAITDRGREILAGDSGKSDISDDPEEVIDRAAA